MPAATSFAADASSGPSSPAADPRRRPRTRLPGRCAGGASHPGTDRARAAPLRGHVRAADRRCHAVPAGHRQDPPAPGHRPPQRTARPMTTSDDLALALEQRFSARARMAVPIADPGARHPGSVGRPASPGDDAAGSARVATGVAVLVVGRGPGRGRAHDRHPREHGDGPDHHHRAARARWPRRASRPSVSSVRVGGGPGRVPSRPARPRSPLRRASTSSSSPTPRPRRAAPSAPARTRSPFG